MEALDVLGFFNMEKKNTILIYTDAINMAVYRGLEKSDLGELMLALFDYSNGKEKNEKDFSSRDLYDLFIEYKKKVDDNEEKYKNRKERNKRYNDKKKAEKLDKKAEEPIAEDKVEIPTIVVTDEKKYIRAQQKIDASDLNIYEKALMNYLIINANYFGNCEDGDKLYLTNKDILKGVGLSDSSKNTIKTARDKLVSLGYIEYKRGYQGNKSEYSINWGTITGK